MSPRPVGRVRKLLSAAAALLLVAVVFARPLGLSASAGPSAGKIALGAIAVVVLAAGLLGRSLLSFYKTAVLLIANTLVLLLLVEAGLLFAARIHDAFVRPDPARAETLRYLGDGREQLPYYRGKPWADTYWREYHRAWNPERLHFEPYLLWQSAPFDGETLRIGPGGVRRTPTSVCRPDALEIWAFGGSAMWGTGVPDAGTIPTAIARLLAASAGRPICVVNLAEQAYVSTQELLRLLFELRSGESPDVVLFYDGVNDVVAAYQAGEAGVPQNLDRIRARFEEPERSLWRTLVAALEDSRTLRLARRSTDRLMDRDRPRQRTAGPPQDVDRLAEEIARTALANYRLVGDLGARHGFVPLFFWQPVLLLDHKPLTEEEADIRQVALEVHPGLAELYAATYGRLRRRPAGIPAEPEVRLLDGALHDVDELCYIDPWHLTAEANRKIARRITDALAQEVALRGGARGDAAPAAAGGGEETSDDGS